MRNIKFFILTIFAAFTTGVVAQKTYTFDDGVALDTDWTVKIDAPSGAKGTCEIASPSKFPEKQGKYLYFGFENKSGITISITSKASFDNISNITFDANASDNSKPNWTLDIVDDNGAVVKNIYSNVGAKERFNTGGTNKWGVSKDDVSPAVTGHIKLTLTASSSGKYAAIDNVAITYQAGPSKDATLKSLKYNGVSVPDFAPEKTHYDVELSAYITALPTITAETNDAKATFSITGLSAIPGTATVDVTAEDGETKKQYTITFTRESSFPKVLTAVWDNIRGKAVIDNVNQTITGTVTNGSSLTLTPTFTGRNISTWTPKDAQDFSAGPVEYTFTNSNSNESTTYTVTITESPAVSSNAQLSDLSVGGQTITNFSPDIYSYDVTVPSSTTTPPAVTYTLSDPKSTAVMTTATGIPGVTYIVVTAEDEEIQSVYTVNFIIAVPSTSLKKHVPGIYESEEGYKGALQIFNGREYEVYYATTSTVDDGKTLAVAVVPQRKVEGITKNAQETSCEAKDGWFKMNAGDKKSDFNPTSAVDEFEAGQYAIHKLFNGTGYELHISGYDQFCFYGKDKESDKSKGKYFKVTIDGKEQNVTPSTTASVRRFNIPSGEHVIKVEGIGESNNEFYGFSLRLMQSPYIRHLRGNDSTQVVYQKRSIPPVTYIAKYNSAPGVKTTLEWKTEPATGIEITKFGKGSAFADTLQLGGQALCPTGLYKYEIVSSLNGVEVQRVAGTFNVATLIIAPSDTVLETYKDEALEVPLRFPYYAYDDNVRIQWEPRQPNGIIFIKSNDTLIVDGTPTELGDFKYEVSAVGGNRIKGMIRIKELDLGNHPILYLYQNNIAYEKDGLYNYLKEKGKNLITRKCKQEARPIEQYRNYEWAIISEDADATNPEVLEVIRGGANLPILNMKAFSYTKGRLGWGEPDNGSVDTITNNGRNIFVEQDEHPIFKKLKKKRGDKIQILSEVGKKGLMPINVTYSGTLCLATAYTRNINDYYKDGELQTFLHEIPASMRGGQKYICLPIALNSSTNLTAEGKRLIDATVEYLLSDDTFEQIPTLQITSFNIDGVRGEMNNDKIHFEIDLAMHQDLDIKAVTPQIALASDYTHVTPASGEAVDFSTSMYKPVEYVVTDYINRRVYEVTVHTYTSEGIEDVYVVGEWVNIFDIYGRKIATTNENIYTMDLPRGVYLIVNENGKTAKIFK